MYSRKPHHVDIAHDLLKSCGIPRDNLPYTHEFIGLRIAFCLRMGEGDHPTYHEFWKLLCAAAKKGGLAKEPRPTGGPVVPRDVH